MKDILALIEKCNTHGIVFNYFNKKLSVEIENEVALGNFLDEIKRNRQRIISFFEKCRPLSFSQDRLWFIDQYEHNAGYNMPGAVKLIGKFDIQVLERTFSEIIKRHEVLRTNFVTINDVPWQFIHEESKFELEIVNLSHLSKEAADSQILGSIHKESQKPFDLANDSLIRFILYTISEEESVLFMNQHHIISDGWSFSILINEITQIYEAYSNGKPSPLTDLPIQYADYAIWQREYVRGELLEKQSVYWKDKLEGVAILELPTDKPRPKEQTFNGNRLPLHLSKALTDKLKQLSKEHDVTLFMTLLSVFKILLQRYTGQSDICVGSPIANRTREEVEGLIGFFVNTLALRSNVATDLPFNKFLKNVRATTMEAYESQDIPFEKVVDIVEPERNLSYSPLFQVMMVLQNNPGGELKFSGLNIEPVVIESVVSKFDITLDFIETGAGLYGNIEYNTDLFDRATIERLGKHFIVLVEQVTENPGTQIKDLEILTPEEKHQLLVEWNATEVDYPRGKCIHHLFEDQVAKTPDNVAIVFETSQLTYGELNEKSNQLAHYLQERGVKPETLVGICVDRSLEMIIGLLGILKAGGAYVPIDPAYPEDRISYMLDDAGCGIVLTQEHIGLVQAGTEVIYLDSDWDNIGNSPTSNVISGVKSDNLAYVIYTSGSTGKPKGTLIEHKSVIRLVSNGGFSFLRNPKVVLQYATISFDASIFEIWGSLCNGSQLIVCPPRNLGIDELGQIIKQFKIEVLWLTSGLFSLVVENGITMLEDVKYLLAGGDVLNKNHVARVLETHKSMTVINGYGPTESTTFASLYFMTQQSAINASVPIGKPLDNTGLYILDKNQKLVPIGIAGELCISGDGLARGYLNQPELTAEQFIKNPFSEDRTSRLYKTGDLARYLPDGNIEFLGRIDDQVKIRGFRIELGEIESVLNKQEGVNASVVIAQEDNGGNKRLVAYIVSDDELNIQELREELSRTLPAYMVPSLFVRLDAMPLASNGKVDKKALPDPEVKAGDDYIAPSGELEDTLVGIWSDILGIDKNEISINQSFFEIGGNSLLTIKLQQKLSRLDEFKHITIPALFKNHTIRMLSQNTRQGDLTEYKLQRKVQIDNREIAIIGMSGAFSGVNNLAEFWQLIKSGSEGVRFYSKEESNKLGGDVTSFEDPDYIPVTGHVKDIDLFDPLFWDVSPNEAKLLDPQIRKFIEHCWFALESSGYIQQRKELNIGVFAGSGSSYYFYNNILSGEMASEINIWEASNANSKDALATKTSYMLGLSGPANSINTACSTGLVSVVEACKSLQLGTCDMVLAGGVSLELPYQIGYTYQEGMILSKDGHCRTFDEDASGTVGGSGVGVVLLKRLEDAIKDNDNIIGVIKGYATNNDGDRKADYTAPSVTGQAECIINAQKMAGISSGEVKYVECHGTATNLGDPIEVQALREAFEFNSPKGFKPKGKTVLGAVKANIGHPNSAAGTAGLLKACLMLQNNMIPGQPNFNTPNPKLNIDQTNFEIAKENKEWLPIPGKQRIAGVSSFGIGGTNAHIIIGDYIPDNNSKLGNTATNSPLKEEHREALNYVIPITAKSKESLELYKQQLINYLTGADKHLLSIEDIAYTLQEKREHFNYRRAYCASDVDELMQELDQNASIGYVSTDFKNRIVFMFPGQGSQYPGMAKELYDNEPYFKTTIDELISRANVYLDIDLHDVIFSEEGRVKYDINETRWAQIVLFIIEYAFAEYIEYLGIHADAYIGHSLGEYVAATLSGVFTLEDAVKVVIARGKLMQSMQEGSMLAINAKEETICTIVDVHKCEIAAMNSIEDIVVSGNDIAINALKADLEEQSISSVILNTSHAYHSRMMEGAAIEFEKLLSGIKLSKPGKIFISNLTGEKAGDEVMSASYWSQQLRNTVQFSKGIDNLANHFNYRINFIEVGPGKGLGSFVTKYKNINNKKTIQALHLLPSIKENAQTIKKLKNKEDILAKLWVSEIVDKPNDLKLFKRASALPDLPTYQFNFKKCWLEIGNLQVPKKYNSLEDICYKRFWERLDMPEDLDSIDGLRDKNILILVNEKGIRKSDSIDLLNTLNRYCDNTGYVVHQQSNTIISDYTFALDNASHIDRIFNEKTRGKSIDIVIYISSGIDIDNPGLDIFAIRNTFDWAYRTRNKIPRFISISFNNYEVLGNEDLAEKPSIVYGVTKSIPFEYFSMDTTAYHVDLSTGLDYNEALILTILQDADKGLIAVRGKFKWFSTYQRASSLNSKLKMSNSEETNDPVFLITGGLGGVGYAYANYLTQKNKRCTIILLGRTKESNLKEDYKARLSKLSLTKHRIIYESIDIGAEDAVSRVGSVLVANGIQGINVVLHAAGVAPRSAINDKTRNDIVSVIQPKILGIENLVKLADFIKINYLVSCSSLASIMPTLGNMEYTAANLYLDELSNRVHSNIDCMLAINLNQISDTGMAVDFIKESDSKMGKMDNSIRSDEFPILLEKLIQFKVINNIILSRYDLNSEISENISALKSINNESKIENEVKIIEDNYTHTEFKIAQIWTQVLGVEEIGLNDNFFEIGGNSLLTIKLQQKLSQLDEFKLITIPELFKYHTIRMLSQSTRQGDLTEYKLQRKVQIDNREIAIIGMSGAFSGVNNLAEFWQLIKSGSEGVRFYSKEESNKLGGDVTSFEDPDYIPVTGHVKDIDLFDPLFWDVSPNEAKLLDPQIRKFIEHCWFALESSGYIQQRKELNIGVFAGSGENNYFSSNILNGEMASEINIWEASLANSKGALATKASHMLGLSGPANSINTACSTGLVSVVEACKSLQLGTCDMVLAGGVSLELPYQIGYTYQEGMISSKDGHCRTFDEDASGTVGGSGVGAVLLKRLEDAIKDNDNIIGVIKGYATNNDGARKTSYTAPSVTGQAECIINAQKMAGVSSGEVEYVECHGTATNLGDPIEVQALREAFEFNSPKGFKPKGKTVLGAVKANIGHVDSAAGTAGLLKACLMLQNNMIPGQPNFNTPNPKLNIDQTNFEIAKENKEWLPIPGKQRIAGVSSFGIGGTNAHVIIGDYIPDNNSKLGNTATNSPLKEEHREALNYVIPITAKSKESLELYKQQLINYLTGADKHLLSIEDIAYTLQEKREHFNYRRAYCASDVDELMQELDQNASIGYVSTDFKNRIVFMFPGQGSQYPGMAKELYDNEPYFKTTIDELISRANVYLDIDLHDVIFSEEGRVKYDINETRWAQIVLFIIEYAFAEYIEYLGIHADAYTGHSLGEYVAATLSGVFTLEDAVKVVIARGKLMQSMQEGSMLAINAKEETICTIVDVHKCEIAAMNSIEDIVVSGNDIAINALKADLEEQSISSVILNTSHAYHSRMMEGAAIEFEKLLSGIKLSKPGKIFISNLTGEKAGDEVMSASYWSQQLRNTVQFSKGIDNLANHFNYRINFIEVGPGKGLGSFVTKYKNINNKKTIQALHLLPSIKENAQTIKKLKNKEDILAKLWVSGIVDKPNDLKLFKRASALPDLPTYQFNFKKCWLEPSKGNDLNGQLKILPKEKWLSTPIWTPVSNLNRTSTKEGVYKKALVFIRKDQLNTFDFTFLAKEIHFIVLYTKKPETEDVGNSKFLFANMKSEHDFNKIAELLKNNNIKYDLIIHASSVDNETQLENALSYSFYSLFLIRQYLLSVNHLKKLLVLTNGLAQITNEDIIDPLNGTLVGAIRNINHEYPNIDARAIDIGRDKNDIEPFISQVVNDGLYEKSEELLAIRFGKLWKESFERIDNSFSEYNLIEENDVILITGGLGGIALSVAKYISNRHKVTFLLVSRHNILNDENPTDYIKQKIGIIDEIRSNGSFVDVYSPDISDAKQVIRLKEQIENKYGHIHGIIHTAGVSPLTIDKYNLANVRNAFKGKVYGVYNIIKNINLSKVKYVVSTSSLASIMGDVNRIEYCASNSYLDYLSIDRIGFKNIKTLSINWPGWSDIGMIRESSINIGEQKGQLKGLQKFLHLNSVTQSDGAEIFYHLINQCNYDQVILSKLNIHDLKNKLWGKEQAFPQDIQLIVNDGSFTATEFKIAQIWSQVLGIKEIGLHDNFFDLGGHSLSATRVISKIRAEFNNELPLKVFFENSTIMTLSKKIDDNVINNKLALIEKTGEREVGQIVFEDNLIDNDELEIDEFNI